MADTIFQTWLFRDYILPFLLMFAIIFAVLEKTKILGEDKKQVNAIVAFVIGMIFVSVLFPKEVVGNLILFLTIAIIVVFIFLLLYGFVVTDKKEGFKVENWMKWTFGILIGIALIVAVIWATGDVFGIIDFLFQQPSTGGFWTNVVFVVAMGLTVLLKRNPDDHEEDVVNWRDV